MQKQEFKTAVRQLAEDAGLRSVGSPRKGFTWVGIVRGILVMMHLDAYRLLLELTSPDQDSDPDQDSGEVNEETDSDVTAKFTEDADEEDLDAFSRVTAHGLPGEWFEQNTGEPWGFQLLIDRERQQELAPRALERLFDRLAEDLHELGAETSQPCNSCGADASTLGYFETPDGPRVSPYCAPCWEATRLETGGVLRVNAPTRAARGWLFLAVAFVVFTTIWAVAQHPNLEIPLDLLRIGGALAAGGVAMMTTKAAAGSSLGLRLGVAGAMLLGTVIGNIQGVKFLLEEQGIFTTWWQMIPIYFGQYFPANAAQEIGLLIGAVIGVLVGFFLMRRLERVRLR